MRRVLLFNALLVLCTHLAAQSASPPTATPVATADKPPWRWTVAERIATRVDPANRAARRTRALSHSRTIREGFTPIDGSVEPELFLPVELITRLVLDTTSPHERIRESYRTPIESRGWNVEHFWEVLHSAGAAYLSLMRESGTRPPDTRERVAVSPLASQICMASGDMMDAAYTEFGREEFDEFLYTAVAPRIKTYIADTRDSADTLHAKARGCR